MSNSDYTPRDSDAWRTFTIASFILAAGMMAGGIYFLEASFAAKGFYAMAAIMLVHTSVGATKTIRDKHESERMNNKIEEAKTDKILREFDQTT